MSSMHSDGSITSFTPSTDGVAVDSSSTSSRFSRLSSVIAKTASLDRSGGSGGRDGTTADGMAFSSATAAAEEAAALFSQPPLSLIDPYRSFVHTLYVYPRTLNLSVKHVFGRVRCGLSSHN